MIEKLLEAFAVMFITIGPMDNAAVFAALAKDYPPRRRRRTALRAFLVSSGVMLFFSIVGDDVLRFLGISLPSLQISGGVLLMIMALQMVIGSPGEDQFGNGTNGGDIAVFPMAMPLIAGPDAIVAVMVLVTKAQPDLVLETTIISMMVLVLFMTYLAMLIATKLAGLLGKGGVEIVSRMLGVILCALAVQFVIDGLKQSNLF